MLTFAYPWLAVLAPLPWLVVWLVPPYAESRPALRVPFLARLISLTGNVPQAGPMVGHRNLARSAVLIAAWLLALAALTRPQWIEPPLHRDQPTRDLLLLVDLSGSMQAQDFVNAAGQTVDRLTAVKEVLDDFLSRREGDRVGVIVFGDAPFTLVPFTIDLKLCRRLVQETEVGMAGPRTAFGDAIGLGITMFEHSTVKYKTMIALTDGNDTASRVEPTEAARIAKDKGIVIHTVAIGDPTTLGEEKLDEKVLDEVARSTGGGFYRALDRDKLAEIYRRLDAIEARKTDIVSYRPKTDWFWWPLAALVLLTMVARGVSMALSGGRSAQGDPVSDRAVPEGGL